MSNWKRFANVLIVLTLLAAATQPAAAQTRLIVRDSLGLSGLKTTCLLLGCTVQWGLGDPAGQVFLITLPSTASLGSFVTALHLQLGIVDAELDLKVRTSGSYYVPPALSDRTPIRYYGQTVPDGYVNQPATQLIRLSAAQQNWNISGSGIVAVIDTGVDATHPVLKPVLLPGYDFTRNQQGADEKADVSQSTAAVLDGNIGWVSQSTAAVLDQSTAAVLDQSQFAAFGHGTMTAGIVHLVAPTALILPLKAFGGDGSGYTSDIIRAINYATRNNATVLSMSFNLPSYSPELASAVSNAVKNGAIPVAAVGNNGQQTTVYPAGNNSVIGVASTNNADTISSFSNWGSMVWLGAPGEGVVTTYPYGTYAAGWGTSFSTPLVAGTVALLQSAHSGVAENQAAGAVGNAVYQGSQLGHGRLDVYRAVQAWRIANGLY
jgi:subtilisin family serine protease